MLRYRIDRPSIIQFQAQADDQARVADAGDLRLFGVFRFSFGSCAFVVEGPIRFRFFGMNHIGFAWLKKIL